MKNRWRHVLRLSRSLDLSFSHYNLYPFCYNELKNYFTKKLGKSSKSIQKVLPELISIDMDLHSQLPVVLNLFAARTLLIGLLMAVTGWKESTFDSNKYELDCAKCLALLNRFDEMAQLYSNDFYNIKRHAPKFDHRLFDRFRFLLFSQSYINFDPIRYLAFDGPVKFGRMEIEDNNEFNFLIKRSKFFAKVKIWLHFTKVIFIFYTFLLLTTLNKYITF